MGRILVIDSDASRRQCLCTHLADFDIAQASSIQGIGDAAVVGLTAIVADASLFDESSELAALAKIVPVVLVSATPSVHHAVASMRAGVADYLTHPLDPGALALAVNRAANSAPAPVAVSEFAPLIGHCPAMRELFDRIKAVATTNATVLIQGASGTGKELVARALHAASKRCHARMISLNCSVVPASLICAELFGSDDADLRRGLVEAADGGTLFLDAIGDLPLETQERLLTLLQQGSVDGRRFDVRLVAATHHDLKQLTENGHFRHDLFSLLHAVVLHVPPLRDRGEDVLALAQDILDRTAAKLNKRGLSFAADALYAMRCYSWPGNVRELENAVERAVILCAGPHHRRQPASHRRHTRCNAIGLLFGNAKRRPGRCR